jgi:hypothetical protein
MSLNTGFPSSLVSVSVDALFSTVALAYWTLRPPPIVPFE